MAQEITQEAIDKLYDRLNSEAKAGGYNLNPDVEFTMDLVRGLLANEARYGYMNCPCRRATGVRAEDLDIICPCDYRDSDVLEYDACYCALYVSKRVISGEVQTHPVPERRPPKEVRAKMKEEREQQALPAGRQGEAGKKLNNLSQPVWRCKVCGYLCARENPPEICPICKVTKDRFERFM